MADERTIKIDYDPATGKWKYTTTGFNIDQNFSDYNYPANFKYGNQLINGQLTVIDHRGTTTVMPDGGHLLQHHLGGDDPEKWPLEVKADADYEKWTGRAGSANED